MSIQFSDTVNNNGIVQQTRKLIRKDSTQWPTINIVNSSNNWHSMVVGYAIGADKNIDFDDTNHEELPEGTTPLVSGQSDYSFLADEQGNAIVTLTGVSLIDADGIETPLKMVDRGNADYDSSGFGKNSGTPSQYDKISDNMIRLDTKPTAQDVTDYDLKYYFQRMGVPFTAASTTATPGVSPILHRGYVIASAYDAALTLGLDNLQALAIERQAEEKKMIEYFSRRNNDNPKPKITMKKILYI